MDRIPAPDAGSHYLWDNWLSHYRQTGLVHRFSLVAPRTLASRERHSHAAVHHWTSADGEAWDYRGAAVERGLPGSFDAQATWSGCAVDFGCCLGLFYTGLAAGTERRQTIAAAFSEDGFRFTKLGYPMLEPCCDNLGYDLGSNDGVDMAWRDPYVFQPPGSEAWHMVWSAKRPRPISGGAFGHAVATDPNLKSWQLLPPIDLPVSYLQMECPAILYHAASVYCFASTKDRVVETSAGANIALRAWRAPTLEGPWVPAGKDGTDVVLDHKHHLYAASFVRLPDREDRVFVTGFRSQSHGSAYSWAPLMRLEWDGPNPYVASP